mmetsp:Transcript_102427/g.184765  ORF Transcript_102427/g.184765 Transcript_102427/m.184765 type:complete len:130 (-) Transcript_102427:11-400(-)
MQRAPLLAKAPPLAAELQAHQNQRRLTQRSPAQLRNSDASREPASCTNARRAMPPLCSGQAACQWCFSRPPRGAAASSMLPASMFNFAMAPSTEAKKSSFAADENATDEALARVRTSPARSQRSLGSPL